jgi:hypothetical protein
LGRAGTLLKLSMMICGAMRPGLRGKNSQIAVMEDRKTLKIV